MKNESENIRESWTDRTELLLGKDKMQRLRDAHVLVVGVGGVGAYAAEMLCRAGVGELTIVDADTVNPTNINRQLPATHSTIGRPKVEVLAERFRDINPDIKLHALCQYLKEEDIVSPSIEGGVWGGFPFDFIVDAIDTIAPKCALIAEAMRRGIPIVSSMGHHADTLCRPVGHLPLRPGQSRAHTTQERGLAPFTARSILYRAGRPPCSHHHRGRTKQEIYRRHHQLHARRVWLLPCRICNTKAN